MCYFPDDYKTSHSKIREGHQPSVPVGNVQPERGVGRAANRNTAVSAATSPAGDAQSEAVWAAAERCYQCCRNIFQVSKLSLQLWV